MKKKLQVVTLGIMLGALIVSPAASQRALAGMENYKDHPEITVAVNGKLVSFPDQPPVVDVVNNRTLVISVTAVPVVGD